MADKTPSSRDIKPEDDFVSRLLKLLPAEITGAYIAVRTICGPEGHENDIYIGVFAVIILVISPLFMRYALKMQNCVQNAFLFFTYIVWVANIEIERITLHEPQFRQFADSIFPWLGSFVHFILAAAFIKGMTVIWVVLLSPFVFTGIAKPKAPGAVVADVPK
jgi:hypothetical protein